MKKYKILILILLIFNLTLNVKNCLCQFAPLPIPGNPAIISAIGSGMYGGNFIIMMAAQENAGIFRSTNNGLGWIQINSGLNNLNIWDIKYFNNEFWATSSNGGIFKTTNAGDNWIPKNSGVPSNYVFEIDFCQVSNRLYTIVYNNGFYVSTDFGSSWNASNSGLTTLQLRTFEIYNALYIGTVGNGVFKSTNNGNNWFLSNNGIGPVNIHDFDSTENFIFTGTYGSGIFRSTDGTNWTPVNNGLGNLGVYSLESPPGGSQDISGSNIFAGTAVGFYASSNNGDSWTARNEGLSGTPEILSLLTGSGYIFAGTNGQGLWRRPLSDIIGIKQTGSEIPERFKLSQNFPNPFNPTTLIKFEIPNSNFEIVSLIIYDNLGREIQTLVKERLSPGTYEVEFDGTYYSSGVYFYTLSSDSYKETKRMVLIK